MREGDEGWWRQGEKKGAEGAAGGVRQEHGWGTGGRGRGRGGLQLIGNSTF